MKLKTKKMVVSAVFAALICVATMSISIPIPATGGYINLGDCLVVLSAWLLGGTYGFAASAIGSMLADIFLGYSLYAPATFIIKGLMALCAYLIFKFLSKLPRIAAHFISALCAEVIMVAGYFIYECFILGFGLGAVPSIFSNMVQAAGGIIISVFIITVIKIRKHK